MRNLKTIISLSLSLFLVACESGPDYVRPKLSMPNLSAKQDISHFIKEKWWTVFNETTLNDLEILALKNNSDLKQAIANIDEARALAGIAASDLFPAIAISGSGNNNYASTKSRNFIQDVSKRKTLSYNAGASTSYELDFFGKYRRSDEAARACLLSTRAAKEAVLLSVTSDVAKTFFLLRALDAKLAIARRTLKTREETYRVYGSRFKNGYCTELDYVRIESEMSSVKTTVLNLETAAAKTENALSVLIGCTPKEMIDRKTVKNKAIEQLFIPTNIPSGIPSDILTRRPDVIQTEGALIAANARIGEARAAYFPSISLTGFLGFESKSLSSLFTTGSDRWDFSGGIYLPIFMGGKITAMNDAADAVYKKTLAAYEKSVQIAFKETLDALITNRKSKEIVQSRTRQVNALKKGYVIAQKQASAGLIGLLDLLDVERGLLAAEMDFVESLQNQLTAVVDLCKALGGGWEISKLNQIKSAIKRNTVIGKKVQAKMKEKKSKKLISKN